MESNKYSKIKQLAEQIKNKRYVAEMEKRK